MKNWNIEKAYCTMCYSSTALWLGQRRNTWLRYKSTGCTIVLMHVFHWNWAVMAAVTSTVMLWQRCVMWCAANFVICALQAVIIQCFWARHIQTLSARLQGTARPGSSLRQVDVWTSLVVHSKIITVFDVKGPPHCSTHSARSASAPSHSPVQQLGTVYLTLYKALNPLTLSKDYLNHFYF